MPKKAAADEPKKKGRRKSYALQEILAHLDDVERWAREGATETQMARYFGIHRTTWYKYRDENPDIFDAIKRGRTGLVEELKGILVRKARGFTYTEKKTIKEKGLVVREEVYTRSSLPDVAALNLLLKNYDRDEWANDPQMLEIRKKEIEIREKQVDATIW